MKDINIKFIHNQYDGYYKTINTTQQYVLNKLLLLLQTKQSQYVRDVDYGLCIQKFMYQNYSSQQSLMENIKKHITERVQKYIPQIKQIKLYFNQNSNVKKNIIIFKLQYQLETTISEIHLTFNNQKIMII